MNCNRVSKTVFKCSGARYTVGSLLALGVPRAMLYRPWPSVNGSFWTREIDHAGVLETARKLFRERSRSLHPDKPGGSLEAMTALNTSWRSIQRRFRQHGHAMLCVALLLCVSGCASRKSTDWPEVFRLPNPETRQAVPARAMAPPPTHQPLSWKFHEPMPVSNVEFTVFSGPTPTGPWTAVTTVDASPVVVATPGQQGFFTVESHWRGLKATLR